MSRYATMLRRPVPQSEPLDGRQVENNAGGFVYQLDKWGRLNRFLILGSDSATYYQKAKALTKENAKCVVDCWGDDAFRTMNTIVEVSVQGRAPKNDPAIFALALGAVHKDVQVRQRALAGVLHVCRTSTHLFMFIDMCRALGRGWGRALKTVVREWYQQRNADSAAYQMVKYRSRENYTHKRLLEAAHVPPYADAPRKALYRWAKGKEYDTEMLPHIVRAHLDAMKDNVSTAELVYLIQEYGLPWEALPTKATTLPEVWRAMLPQLGLTAAIRNLGKMTAIGALKPFDADVGLLCGRLRDVGEIKKARVHPFNVLQALVVYKSGKGVRGELSWKPIPSIVAALDDAFYLAFQNVEPSGKRTLIGLDVSGSMSSPFMGSALTVAEASAAMAMVTMKTEKDWHVYAFDQGMRDLHLNPRMDLTTVVARTSDINGGGTDCALPMLEAMKHGWLVDVFQVQTDNETWAGRTHPVRALKDYRQKTGIAAKLVVIGMTATNFTIADPDDAGMLDVVGFDASAPAVIADFARQ